MFRGRPTANEIFELVARRWVQVRKKGSKEERKKERKEERNIGKIEDLKKVQHALTRSVGGLTVAILNQATVNHSHNINVEGLLFFRT